MENLTMLFPVLAVSSVVLLILLKVYFKIREYLPISVNCWFCNTNSKVAYLEYNSWTCSKCDQYNGFTQDGDYNRMIAAQHDEFLNAPLECTPKSPYRQQGPTLCASCNLHQQMKVMRLAAFQPMDARNFDAEVDQYSEQLDKLYDLCKACERTVASVLEEQRSKFPVRNEPEVTGATRASRNRKKLLRANNRFVYYGTLLSCVPQLSMAMSRLDVAGLVAEWLPEVVVGVPRQYGVLAVAAELYRSHYWHLSVGCIAVSCLVCLLDLLRQRSVLKYLNLSAWLILLGLKYFSPHIDHSIVLLQGVTAAVFLCMNRRSSVSHGRHRVVTKRMPPSASSRPRARPLEDVAELSSRPHRVSSSGGANGADALDLSVNSYFNSSHNLSYSETSVLKSSQLDLARGMSTPANFTNAHAPQIKAEHNGNASLLKPMYQPQPITGNLVSELVADDLGISSLNLGSEEDLDVMDLRTRSVSKRSGGSVRRSTRILSPSKLKVDAHYAPKSGHSHTHTEPHAECSTKTVGFGSMSFHDREFDRLSDGSPSINQLAMPNYCLATPYQFMYQPMQISPYAYYQFASMSHRMYTPPISPLNFGGSGCEATKTPEQLNSSQPQPVCLHSKWPGVFITILLFCNLGFMTLFAYKEFISTKV